MELDDSTLRNPKLILRSYQPDDLVRVQELFAGTYYGLVPDGIRAKLRSPITWLVWVAGFVFLQTVVPAAVFGADRENSWPEYFLKLASTLAWLAAGFVVFFLMTERCELVDRVQEARQNDLTDPEAYYLNWTVSATGNGSKRVKKSAAEQTPSHFWVLTVDGQLSGMVGLAVYNKAVQDRRTSAERKHKAWWTVDADAAAERDDVFAEPTPPKTAILQRLAIAPDYQRCGLSALLINRAMIWAHEHGIDTVVAYTNEMQRTAEKMLIEHHGFVLEHKRRKWLSYQSKLVCNVEAWMAKHGEQSKSLYDKQR